MKTVATSLLLCFLTLSGCGSGSEEASSAEELFRERADIACRKQSECCAGSASPSARYNSCIATTDDARHSLATTEEELAQAVKKGNSKIDMNRAYQCFADVAALECQGWAQALTGAPPLSCTGGIILGMLEEGAPCEHHYECESQVCGDANSSEPARLCSPRSAAPRPCVDAECAGICAANPSSLELFEL